MKQPKLSYKLKNFWIGKEEEKIIKTIMKKLNTKTEAGAIRTSLGITAHLLELVIEEKERLKK